MAPFRQAVYVPADDLTDPAPVRCSVARVSHFLGSFIYIDGDALRVSVVFLGQIHGLSVCGSQKNDFPSLAPRPPRSHTWMQRRSVAHEAWKMMI